MTCAGAALVLAVAVAAAGQPLASQALVVEESGCRVTQAWHAPTVAITLEGETVEVVQESNGGDGPQNFHVRRCLEEGSECRWSAPGSGARCKTEFNVVPAIVRDSTGEPTWQMIQVPSSCVCSRNVTLPIPNV